MKFKFVVLAVMMVLSACSPAATPQPKADQLLTPKSMVAATQLTTPLPPPLVGTDTLVSELAQAPTPAPHSGYDIAGLPDVVALRQRLLFSHTTWRSLWADGWVVYYAGDGSTNPTQAIHTQVWLEQPAKARVLSGSQDGPQSLWVSDGFGFRQDGGPVQELPPFIKQNFNPSAVASDTITPYPLAGMLGTPLADLLFPTALAQRNGEFQVVGQADFAGRKAIVVLWANQPGGLIVDQMWIDAETGIILRLINYGKPGGESISSEMYFSSLLIDPTLPELAFAVGLPAHKTYASSVDDLPAP